MEKVNQLWAKTNRWHRGLFLFILVELRIFPGGQVGFECNDPNLSHPYTGDTISWKVLFITTMVLPLIFMLIVERKYHADKSTHPKTQVLCWYKEYLFGFLLNLIVVQVLKLLVGSPRPHFFETCDPKELATCKGSEYVSSYTCNKAHWLSQSDRSFPSGHTSLAVHAGFFVAYYLHRRTSCSQRLNAVTVLQVICVVTAIFCGVSRIMDHRHHWWDVLAGAVIAAPILVYTIKTLCSDFECLDNEPSEKTLVTESSEIPLIDTKET
ncbi:hypothetical protein K1T71_010457 [Dendrolimus kikuchii]|uniref:Uncharacterized protein n=1 Tax=Dendrolimus kikuchii TaxID=765133 RepID=A0ACC1CRT4_9NEOP|nr:hypothetical protein K1T71_010457 [Dendrolimus kikuchii]